MSCSRRQDPRRVRFGRQPGPRLEEYRTALRSIRRTQDLQRARDAARLRARDDLDRGERERRIASAERASALRSRSRQMEGDRFRATAPVKVAVEATSSSASRPRARERGRYARPHHAASCRGAGRWSSRATTTAPASMPPTASGSSIRDSAPPTGKRAPIPAWASAYRSSVAWPVRPVERSKRSPRAKGRHSLCVYPLPECATRGATGRAQRARDGPIDPRRSLPSPPRQASDHPAAGHVS